MSLVEPGGRVGAAGEEGTRAMLSPNGKEYDPEWDNSLDSWAKCLPEGDRETVHTSLLVPFPRRPIGGMSASCASR